EGHRDRRQHVGDAWPVGEVAGVGDHLPPEPEHEVAALPSQGDVARLRVLLVHNAVGGPDRVDVEGPAEAAIRRHQDHHAPLAFTPLEEGMAVLRGQLGCRLQDLEHLLRIGSRRLHHLLSAAQLGGRDDLVRLRDLLRVLHTADPVANVAEGRQFPAYSARLVRRCCLRRWSWRRSGSLAAVSFRRSAWRRSELPRRSCSDPVSSGFASVLGGSGLVSSGLASAFGGSGLVSSRLVPSVLASALAGSPFLSSAGLSTPNWRLKALIASSIFPFRSSSRAFCFSISSRRSFLSER